MTQPSLLAPGGEGFFCDFQKMRGDGEKRLRLRRVFDCWAGLEPAPTAFGGRFSEIRWTGGRGRPPLRVRCTKSIATFVCSEGRDWKGNRQGSPSNSIIRRRAAGRCGLAPTRRRGTRLTSPPRKRDGSGAVFAPPLPTELTFGGGPISTGCSRAGVPLGESRWGSQPPSGRFKGVSRGGRGPHRAVARWGKEERTVRLRANTWSPRLSRFRDDVEIPPLVVFLLFVAFSSFVNTKEEKASFLSAVKADKFINPLDRQGRGWYYYVMRYIARRYSWRR